ncbi:hypothetical protein D3Z36_15530 [Lachnospiraceae bacterium]|nr:hypothetical protein [Lachnospiraceae bacterium]
MYFFLYYSQYILLAPRYNFIIALQHSARYHISRLEALKLQVQQSLELMFGNQFDRIDAAMRKTYKEV